MILIGQYDSSFTRRIAIALKLYHIDFEHRPWSVFSDADRLAEINPLIRVPALVLDDGDVLVDSHMIIDYLDRHAPKGISLFPAIDPDRYRAMKIAALATGATDKAVALFYEIHMHDAPSDALQARLTRQIEGALAALESSREQAGDEFFHGASLGHADIAVACAFRHITEALPGVIAAADYPVLHTHCARMEALPVFAETSQAFIPPK